MEKFLKSLKRKTTDDVFNPWYQFDPINDIDKNSHKIRLENLKQFLSDREKAKYLIIGEALGYQGGHFTGIAMTSERIFLGKMKNKNIDVSNIFKNYFPQRTSKIEIKKFGFSENTATIVWGTILNENLNPFDFVIWNAFPWHPYNKNKGMLSNRTPTENELAEGKIVLNNLIQIQNFHKIIAVGKKSEKLLSKMGIQSFSVRHPAYGGATEFRNQFLAIV